MYARVTPYQMKPGSRGAATKKLETLKERILGMKGMHSFTNVMNDDHAGYIIALVESRALSEANAETVKSLWGEFAEYLVEPPKPQGYDVIVDWHK
ncbi:MULTISPECIES: hypothetical protein [Roseovarius]|uniref:hypothetical protein n=1 Tax=Roseovarius TaxID=74030 RepID=UPI001C098ECB|nr:hypothetical protein [Roseovarius nubinhibens]MBU2998208.1 hypothetical protein [Roseovarius nubinhibens]